MARVSLLSIAAFLVLATGVAQGAEVPPSVVSESVSQVTATSATLEASIASGSAPAGAYYQFQLSEFPTEFPDELNCPPPPESGPFLPCEGPESPAALPIGHIPQAADPAAVALDLGGAEVALQPGTTYYFRVVVAAAAESEDTIEWEDPVVGGGEHTFTTAGVSSPPVVTGESSSQVSADDATLEASIDTAAGAYYQFQLSEFPTEFPDELSCPPPPVLGLPACVGPQSDTALPIGFVPAGGGNAALRLSDAGLVLKPGATYYFRVVAATAEQTEDSVEWEQPVVAGELQAFTVAPAANGTGQETPAAAGGVSQSAYPASIPPRLHRHRHHRRLHSHSQGLAAIALARIAR